jgi:two-component system sensor histidine kinase TctE
MIRFRALTIRLLLALVVPLLVSSILIGLGGAWVIRSVVDYTSDRLLAGSVRAIAESATFENGRLQVDMPPWSLALLDSPQRDSVYYSVRHGEGLLTGYNDLPRFDAARSATGPVFRTLIYAGQPVRQAAQAYRVPGVADPIIVSVAQTLDSRLAVRKQLMTSAGLMELTLVSLVALLIWPAAKWSLSPVGGLLRELSNRAHARDLDFTPVPAREVPDELQPIVLAFNNLLGQLERSVEGVRRFTADASHQMRTPLAILKTHLTLLNRKRRPAADRESLADAIDAVDRLQRLIEQLLGLARADAVDEQGQMSSDLGRVVQAVGQRWRPRVEAAGVTLSVAQEDIALPVGLGAPLVEQILENLIDNAVRYGGTSIRIAAWPDETWAVLDVLDNGPGLPDKVRARVFERFVRGSDDVADGSGLGLSIIKALAERCGGQVDIGGDPDGGDFRVRVRFPLTGAAVRSD